jgi:hypothetical protein
VVNLAAFSYLALVSSSRLAQILYLASAVATTSGILHALTFLRRTNGALSIRAKKVAGPGEDPTALAVTYASSEKRSIEREAEWSSMDLVRRWQWHNNIRTAVLIVGMLMGLLAALQVDVGV